MKKFEWRLQKVLDVNEKKQQAKQVELFQANEKLATTRASLLAEKRILRDLIEKIAADKDVNRFSQQQLLLKSTKHNDEMIKKYEQEIVQLEELRKKLTEEFLKLKKSTEALEKLREQHKREFIAEQEKLEQKESDEHTSIRFARLSSGK